MAYCAIRDKVIVKVEKTPASVNGVIVPDTARKEHYTGAVVSAGPLADDIRAGDRVIYYPLNGHKLDETHRVLLRQDILAVVHE